MAQNNIETNNITNDLNEIASKIESSKQGTYSNYLPEKIRNLTNTQKGLDDLKKELSKFSPAELDIIKQNNNNPSLNDVLNVEQKNENANNSISENSQDESKNQNNGSILDNIEEKGSSAMTKIENGWKDLTNGWDKKIEKFEKMWTSFSEGFDKLSDSLFSWKLTDSYKILGMIFSSGGFSLEKWEKMKKDEEDKKNGEINPSIDNLNKNELVLTAEYTQGTNLLYMIAGEDLSQKSKSKLLAPQISSKSYTDLLTEYNNSRGIAKRLNFPKGTDNDNEVIASIDILKKSENFIDNLLKKDFPDWRKEKIFDIVKLINNKGGLSISSLKQKVEGLSINGISDIKGVLPELAKKLEIKVNDSGEIDYGEFGTRKEKINGLKKETLIKIFSAKNIEKVTTNSTCENTENNIAGETEENSEDRKFIKDVYKYKDEIISNIINYFPEEKREKAKTFFNTNGFTFKELSELFLLTGGNSNIKSLNSIEQPLFLIKMTGIFSKDNDSGITGDFIGIFYDKIMDSNDFSIPENVKNIFKVILFSSVEKALKITKGFINDVWSFASTETKIEAGIIIAGLAGGYIALGKFRNFANGAIAMGATTGIGALYYVLSHDEGSNKYMKSQGVNNENDFEKITGNKITN